VEFDVDLLVEVFVPTSADGNRGEVATGYPVAPGLILTTGHVFREHQQPHPIGIRWLGQRNLCIDRDEDPETAWIEKPIETCRRWLRDDDRLDAALLRFPCYDAAKRPGPLAPARLRVHTDPWVGGGFPKVPKRDGHRPRVVFKGATTPMGETERVFHITIEEGVKGATEQQAKDVWRGASGMPVFCAGGIVGVVKVVPHGFKGERLEVVPHWRLLEDPNFLRELRAADEGPRRGDPLGAVRRMLDDNRPLVQLLSRVLALGEGEGSGVGAVLKRLQGLDEARAVSLLLGMWERLGHDRKAPVAADEFIEFAMALLPLVADPAIGLKLRALEEKRPHFVELPLFHETPLEIAMASADGQPASLRPCAAPGHFPAGVYNVQPRQPEPGNVDDDDVDAVFAELASRVGLTLGGDLERWTKPQQNQLLARRLTDFEQICRRRHYLARRIDADRSNVEDLSAFAAKIRQRLASLPLVALHETFENCSRDEEIYHRFCLILSTNKDRTGARVS